MKNKQRKDVLNEINNLNKEICLLKEKKKELETSVENKLIEEKVENIYIKVLDREKKDLENERDLGLKALDEKYKNDKETLEKKEASLKLIYSLKFKELADLKKDYLNDAYLKIEETKYAKAKELQEEIEKTRDEFKKEIQEKKEELLKREEEINKLENEQNHKYELASLEYKTIENELEKKTNELNNKIEGFNKKRKHLLNNYSFSKRLKHKYKKNKKTFITYGVTLIILLCFIFNYFQYGLFCNLYITKFINKFNNLDANKVSYLFLLDTSECAVSEFKNLDNLYLKLDVSNNSNYLENYSNLMMNSGNNTYNWERFNKNKTIIMKSASDGQYITTDINTNGNITYIQNQENDIFFTNIKKYVSKLNLTDIKEINKFNQNSNNNIVDYLESLINAGKTHDYYYELKGDNNLFHNIFDSYITSSNYTSFFNEETEIQDKLKLTDNTTELKNILNKIIMNSECTNTDINLLISKNNLKSLDMKFTLSYKDDSMVNPVKFKIRLSCDFSSLNKDNSLEKDNFTLNSVNLSDLVPRETYEDYEEVQSAPFEEQTTTYQDVKDLLSTQEKDDN